MAFDNLSKDLEFVDADTTTAAGTGAVTSDAIEVGGAYSVVGIVNLGVVVANGTNVVKMTECDTSGGSYSNITSATTGTITNNANTLAVVEVIRPKKRYVQIVCTRAVENTTIEGMTALVKGRKNGPITQGTTVAEAPTVVIG